VKNGSIHNGKQKYRCCACGRNYVDHPLNIPISDRTKQLLNKLLLEKIPLVGIARVTGVSERWLQKYINRKYEIIPRQIEVKDKSKGRLTIECDEMWSFGINSGFG